MPNYRYNLVELPELPSVDKTAYPYAIILPTYAGSYTLRYLAAAVLHRNSVGNITVKDTTANLSNIFYEYNGSEWVGDGVAKNLSIAFTSSYGVTWANYDVLNSDGSVYLPASEPVPVPNLEWQGKDIYLSHNGAWVKCDAVRKMNGEWVTQDEYLI